MCKLYFKVLSFFLLFCCVINLLRCLGAEVGAGTGAGAGAGAGAGTDKTKPAGRLTLPFLWCSG